MRLSQSPHRICSWFIGTIIPEGGGNFTHTSDHGIFPELDNAITYAVTLIEHAENEMKISLDASSLDGDVDSGNFDDLTSNWDSQQLNIVGRSGEVLFSQSSIWAVSKEHMVAEMVFDHSTADEIWKTIKLARSQLTEGSAE